MFILGRSSFHQGLVVEQLQRVHLLPVLFILLVLHLLLQNALMLLVHLLQVLGLVLLIIVEVVSVFFPHHCLFLVDLLLLNLLDSLFLHLPGKVLSHLLLLLLLFAGLAFFILLFLPQLTLNVSQHLIILLLDLFLLVLDHWVSKRRHHMLYLLFTLTFLMVPLPLQLILQSCVLLLHLDVLKLEKKITSSLYLSAYSLSRLSFS